MRFKATVWLLQLSKLYTLSLSALCVFLSKAVSAVWRCRCAPKIVLVNTVSEGLLSGVQIKLGPDEPPNLSHRMARHPFTPRETAGIEGPV
jgi:hypothetical protein